MKKEHRTKMQRQVASQRKTWTVAECFEKKEKNRLRLLAVEAEQNKVSAAQRYLAEAEREIAQEHTVENKEG